MVSWDLDGTLYEMKAMRGSLHRRAFRRCLSSVWRGPQELLELVQLQRQMKASRGNADRVEAFLQSESGQRFMRLQAEWISESIRVCGARAEAAPVMRCLHEHGIKQVVFSDYPVGQKLVALGVEQWVDHVVVAADTFQVKPDPRVFERLCQELSVRPEQVLHVGDREDTDGGATRAGISTLILGREIHSLSEVPQRLGLA